MAEPFLWAHACGSEATEEETVEEVVDPALGMCSGCVDSFVDGVVGAATASLVVDELLGPTLPDPRLSRRLA